MARGRLAALVGENRLRAQLAAERWRHASPTVVVLHNGPLTLDQQRWAAVLTAGPDAALAGRTALSMAGLRNWEDDGIHVLVPLGHRMTQVPDVRVVFHQSRSFTSAALNGARPARTPVPRSAIDAATWSRSPRAAAGLLAAVVQQRLTTAELLRQALRLAGPIRHAPLLRSVLADVAGGADALTEIDFGKLCRRFGLPAPVRQQIRLDSTGRRRYLDATLRGPDGREVGVEIDGALHMVATQWWQDVERDNELRLSGDLVLHFPSLAVYLHPERVAVQLLRALGMR